MKKNGKVSSLPIHPCIYRFNSITGSQSINNFPIFPPPPFHFGPGGLEHPMLERPYEAEWWVIQKQLIKDEPR